MLCGSQLLERGAFPGGCLPGRTLGRGTAEPAMLLPCRMRVDVNLAEDWAGTCPCAGRGPQRRSVCPWPEDFEGAPRTALKHLKKKSAPENGPVHLRLRRERSWLGALGPVSASLCPGVERPLGARHGVAVAAWQVPSQRRCRSPASTMNRWTYSVAFRWIADVSLKRGNRRVFSGLGEPDIEEARYTSQLWTGKVGHLLAVAAEHLQKMSAPQAHQNPTVRLIGCGLG